LKSVRPEQACFVDALVVSVISRPETPAGIEIVVHGENPKKKKGGECPALMPKVLIDLAVALAQERQCDHPEDEGTADRIPVDDGPVSVGAADMLFLGKHTLVLFR
jgi:hypothetical protein